MPGVLEGKSGLVTGGGRGIGRAIALELGRHGANVAVGYSGNTEAAQSAVDELERLGVQAMAVKGNVAVPEEVKPSVASVAEHFGKIDFLVNNAGITRDRSLAKMQHDDWNAVIDVNLHSIFNVTHEVLPYMLEQGYGRIINISSVIGQMGNFGQANYATAKAGMIGFTKSAALEFARKGITINCVAPGYTETEMVQGVPEAALEKVLARIPMGRLGQPQEMAQAVFFLIAYGDYITGQVIAVNGGMYM
ncbi:MAG: 3-oxoacyl-ACP reductase [Chloroflexota bacterium]|nr:3-oxoacyl-ACP reductase [Chloroflexota bacterium]